MDRLTGLISLKKKLMIELRQISMFDLAEETRVLNDYIKLVNELIKEAEGK